MRVRTALRVAALHGVDELRARRRPRTREKSEGQLRPEPPPGRSHGVNITPNAVLTCGASPWRNRRRRVRLKPDTTTRDRNRRGNHPEILRHLPQRPAEDRRADAGRRGRRSIRPRTPRPGKRSSASCGRAPCRRRTRPGPTPRPSTRSPALSRDEHRPRRAGVAPSRQARARPSAEPHGIPERDSRSAGARRAAEGDRLPAAPAGRQLGERLRQHRRPAVHVAGDHGALSRRGREDQPPRRRRHARAGDGEPLSPQRRAVAGRARRRSAVGHARRRAAKTTFPVDGEYLFRVQLSAPPAEPHQLEITVDGERAQIVTVGASARGRGRGRASTALGARPPSTGPGQAPDATAAPRTGEADPDRPIEFRIPVKAGPRLVGITFIERDEVRDESTLRPRMRSRGTEPALSLVTISGPYGAKAPGDSPSRRRIFVVHHAGRRLRQAHSAPR